MTIAFSEVLPTTRTPFVYAEFDASRAVQASPAQPYMALLVGQRRTGVGSVSSLTLVRVQNKDQAAQFFGVGSQLANMAEIFFANNSQTECWAIAMADPAGAAAVGSFTLSGSPTEAGSFVAYVAGRRFSVPVASGATPASIAALVVAAINADTSLPVTAAQATGAINLTARHLGTIGNDVDLRHSYQSGEALPAGLLCNVSAMSGGSGDPDVSLVWPKIGDVWFNVAAVPFTDATNLTSLETELASRANAYRNVDMDAYAAKTGTLSTVQTLGDSRNAPRSRIMGTNGSPTPPWEWSAALCAVVARNAAIDPARPFQFLPLLRVLAPTVAQPRWTQAERNSLLFHGISTFIVAADGTVQIERLIATYKTNAQGGADPSYLDDNTTKVLSAIRYEFRNLMSTRYSRHKVADDGTRFGAGQLVVTPSLIRGECAVLFRQWEEKGWVEGFEQFKAELIVERNSGDPSRMDVYLPPNLVNGLRVLAAKIGFIL